MMRSSGSRGRSDSVLWRQVFGSNDQSHNKQTMTIREQAHRQSVVLGIDAVAAKLEQTLGQQLTAYAVGLKDPRAIGKYARGNPASSGPESRLRDLYVIVQVLLASETAETIRAWMIGAHPNLEDQAPVQLLHEENTSAPDDATEPKPRWSYGTGSRSKYQAVLEAAIGFIGPSAAGGGAAASGGGLPAAGTHR